MGDRGDRVPLWQILEKHHRVVTTMNSLLLDNWLNACSLSSFYIYLISVLFIKKGEGGYTHSLQSFSGKSQIFEISSRNCLLPYSSWWPWNFHHKSNRGNPFREQEVSFRISLLNLKWNCYLNKSFLIIYDLVIPTFWSIKSLSLFIESLYVTDK